MKSYEVTINISAEGTVIVEAKDEREAISKAYQVIDFGDFEDGIYDQYEVIDEVDTES